MRACERACAFVGVSACSAICVLPQRGAALSQLGSESNAVKGRICVRVRGTLGLADVAATRQGRGLRLKRRDKGGRMRSPLPESPLRGPPRTMFGRTRTRTACRKPLRAGGVWAGNAVLAAAAAGWVGGWGVQRGSRGFSWMRRRRLDNALILVCGEERAVGGAASAGRPERRRAWVGTGCAARRGKRVIVLVRGRRGRVDVRRGAQNRAKDVDSAGAPPYRRRALAQFWRPHLALSARAASIPLLSSCCNVRVRAHSRAGYKTPPPVAGRGEEQRVMMWRRW